MARISTKAGTLSALALAVLLILFTVQFLGATGGTADHFAGQIDFNHGGDNFIDGRGFNSSSAVAIDPVGGEVYVADYSNNRVLGWKSAAEFTGNQPADIVIGQPDFYSYLCNQISLSNGNGTVEPAQNSLCNPEGLAVDADERVYVSDNGNNRVLVFDNPFALMPGQNSNFAARLVIGQGSGGNNFTSPAAASGQTGLYRPVGLSLDSNGNLFVLDAGNNRALEYFNPFGAATSAGAGDVVADRVFGQPDFNANQPNQGGAVTAQTLSTANYGGPAGIATDSYGNLYVADDVNGRVVEYNGPFDNTANDPSANLIFSGFRSYTVAGVVVDGANNLYFAAANSNGQSYVYQFAETSNPPSNTTANLVFGPTMNIAADPTAYLGASQALATDASNNLFMANSNRVIEYLAPGNANGSAPGSAGDSTADAVLGQADFDHTTANFVDALGMHYPGGVAIDQTANPNHIYVLDLANNRVLGWNSLSGFSNHQPADLVVGQSDFYSSSHDVDAAHFALDAGGQVDQGGIAVDRYGNLFVTDAGFGRVLEFSNPFAAWQSGQNSNFSASTVFGQNGQFDTYNACDPSTYTASQGSLCFPTGLAFDPVGNLYVADAGNSRVLEFVPDANGSFGPTPMPTAVIGQTDYNSRVCANGASDGGANPNPTPGPNNLCGSAYNFNSLGVSVDPAGNLYIADFHNSRVLEFTPASPGNFGPNPSASVVFGQGASGTSFNTNYCGSGSPYLCHPAAVAIDSMGNVYIADNRNSRVLEYDETTQPASNVTASRALGASDFNTSSCNAGNNQFQPTANSLCLPYGLGFDVAGHLYVADTSNNRVVEYDQPLSIAPTPTATSTPTATATATATLTPTATPTVTVTPTATPTPICTSASGSTSVGVQAGPVQTSGTVSGTVSVCPN
jgi:sugar lactone lactonase YvrE